MLRAESKIADVAALGSVLRRELQRQGYKPEQRTAVLVGGVLVAAFVPWFTLALPRLPGH